MALLTCSLSAIIRCRSASVRPVTPGALDIQHTHRAAGVKERHANLRDDVIHRRQKCRLGKHILDQFRLACPHDAAHNAGSEWNFAQDKVVADLMLQPESVLPPTCTS